MEEKRGSVRIKDRLQVAYRLPEFEEGSHPESPEKFFPYIWSKYPSSVIVEEGEDGSFKTLSHIIDLNRKVDILIELLTSEVKPPVEVPPMRNVCISATGMKIVIGEPAVPGQRIALCVIFPFVPPATVFIMGEVTRSIPADPLSDDPPLLYEAGIRFLNLREEDYEKIVKYIFKRQRDLLKDKKRLTCDMPSD